MYTLIIILLVVTLLFVAANVFISFRMRNEVQKNLALAERRDSYLSEEQERLTFHREERQMLIEELKQVCQGDSSEGSQFSKSTQERLEDPAKS